MAPTEIIKAPSSTESSLTELFMNRITYLEVPPSPALQPFLRSLWYCHAPEIDHTQERVLPNGSIQIVLNLARNYLTDGHGGRLAPAIIVGASGQYEIIDTEDLTELVGIVIKPGGFTGLFREPADLF